MSAPDRQAALDAQPVYETDIWNPLAADGPLQVLHSRMPEPEPLPELDPEIEMEPW